MATICSLFLFRAVLFSLHSTQLLGHSVGSCPLHNDCIEDAGWHQCFSSGGQVHVMPATWWDGSTRRRDALVVPVCCPGRRWAVGRGGWARRVCPPRDLTVWGWHQPRLWGQLPPAVRTGQSLLKQPCPFPFTPLVAAAAAGSPTPHVSLSSTCLSPPTAFPLAEGACPWALVRWRVTSYAAEKLGASCDYVDLLSFTGWKNLQQ